MGDFNESLCGCFSDIETCLCVWCCPCIQFGRNAEKVKEGQGILCGVLWFVVMAFTGLGCVLQFYMRGQIREKYGMEANPLMDLLCSWFCGCCTMAQEARELKARG
eukprot:TRINITY_DN16853_c0_g1_i1.p1 TRINITY_DN16853_c0_g1~~TRINITY_DN16853_c0_g1_i1.p1  ORF type:complete len:106 (+),score=5.20 TRINITY_DN16853_c0_g1_i1:99-416(+)